MFFTGRMPFLPPNQQHQSTEGETNDLINHLKIGVCLKLFADVPDDVKVYAKIVDPCNVHQLQCTVESLVEWAETWQLPISINKCCAMHISNDTM